MINETNKASTYNEHTSGCASDRASINLNNSDTSAAPEHRMLTNILLAIPVAVLIFCVGVFTVGYILDNDATEACVFLSLAAAILCPIPTLIISAIAAFILHRDIKTLKNTARPYVVPDTPIASSASIQSTSCADNPCAAPDTRRLRWKQVLAILEILASIALIIFWAYSFIYVGSLF